MSNHKQKTRVKIEQIVKAYNEMLHAVRYYKDGIDHFYKHINFAKSNLDADSILFMNEHQIKFSKALKLAEEVGEVETI